MKHPQAPRARAPLGATRPLSFPGIPKIVTLAARFACIEAGREWQRRQLLARRPADCLDAVVQSSVPDSVCPFLRSEP